MLVLGVDAHKRTHTIVAIDERATPCWATHDQSHQRPPGTDGSGLPSSVASDCGPSPTADTCL
jgi:hypothetical protein